jgi:chromosome segregation ATPase
MEFEQIIKRLDWLDEEHRKDKINIDNLTVRAANLEGELKAAEQKIKELTGQMSNVSSAAARIEQYDNALAQQRANIIKYIDDLEKKDQDHQDETEKQNLAQFNGIDKSITKIREFINENKREHTTRTEEEKHRTKLMADWENRMQSMIKTMEDTQRNQNATEENRRQDNKRLADLQGEISVMRKRMDDSREKNDLSADSVRRLEARLNEIIATDVNRRQTQVDFVETQSRLQVERDRAWKKWEDLVNSLTKQSEVTDHNLQEWDVAQRGLKRTRESYEEIIQKFERRINEITEMQRLSEDRLRQEWVSFKADDLKRWSGYNLSQDELHKDTRTIVTKNEGRLAVIEDMAQTQQDILQQTKEANEQLLQGILSQIHELLSAYERIMSTK